MSWILGFLALACFGWAATLALLIRAMEERDQARDMCVLLMFLLIAVAVQTIGGKDD